MLLPGRDIGAAVESDAINRPAATIKQTSAACFAT